MEQALSPTASSAPAFPTHPEDTGGRSRGPGDWAWLPAPLRISRIWTRHDSHTKCPESGSSVPGPHCPGRCAHPLHTHFPKGLISAAPTCHQQCQLPLRCPDPVTTAAGPPGPRAARLCEPVTSSRGTGTCGPDFWSQAGSRWPLLTGTVLLKSPSDPGHQTGASTGISATSGHWAWCRLPSSSPRMVAMRAGCCRAGGSPRPKGLPCLAAGVSQLGGHQVVGALDGFGVCLEAGM